MKVKSRLDGGQAHSRIWTLIASRSNRVIFVALTNILLITALVSLVSNSLTEVSDRHEHRTSMVVWTKTGPQRRDHLSVIAVAKGLLKRRRHLSRLFQIR